MKNLTQLESVLNKGSQETDTVRILYMVMCKVGGYEQLMNLAVSSIQEIIKCMEWEAKEQSKGMKGRKR